MTHKFESNIKRDTIIFIYRVSFDTETQSEKGEKRNTNIMEMEALKQERERKREESRRREERPNNFLQETS